MIYLKTNPVGIDIKIQQVQQRLYDKLSVDLSCDISAYGRAYVNNDNGSVKPLAYLTNGEHRELLTDDTIKGLHFFFIENESSKVVGRSGLTETEVDIIFIIDDISKAKSSITHYADEELKEDIKKYLTGTTLEPTSIVKGEKALDGFDIKDLKFIYPYYVFKITTINNY